MREDKEKQEERLLKMCESNELKDIILSTSRRKRTKEEEWNEQ